MPAHHTVLYDGDCMFCTFQSRVITWLDWFHAIRLVPIADPSVAEIAPGIAREDLHEAMHCVSAADAFIKARAASASSA
jgi:predicted DCC family thiol-disulfide oxidoreductase YuxK